MHSTYRAGDRSDAGLIEAIEELIVFKLQVERYGV